MNEDQEGEEYWNEHQRIMDRCILETLRVPNQYVCVINKYRNKFRINMYVWSTFLGTSIKSICMCMCDQYVCVCVINTYCNEHRINMYVWSTNLGTSTKSICMCDEQILERAPNQYVCVCVINVYVWSICMCDQYVCVINMYVYLCICDQYVCACVINMYVWSIKAVGSCPGKKHQLVLHAKTGLRYTVCVDVCERQR
jgi:hypothetical protein